MSRPLPVRRTLALSSALLLTSWGTLALPAAADPGNGKSGQGKSSHAKAGHAKPAHAPAKASSGRSGSEKAGSGKSGSGKTRPSTSQGHGGSGAGAQKQQPAPTSGKPAPKGNGGSSSSPAAKGGGKPTTSGGSKGSPAGNNGTVKIAYAGENDGTPQNSPHQPCTFQIEWYGYEEGADIVSTVSFASQAPTSDSVITVDGPSSVPVGGDPATGAGTETGLDGSELYTLSFTGDPHPKQGYHVKLTVTTPRSKGNDTKTKVFWVEPCEDGDTTTPPGDTTDEDTTDEDTTDEDTTDEDTTDEDTTDEDTSDETTTDEDTSDETTTDEDTTDDQSVTGGAQTGSGSGSADSGAQVPTAVDAGEQNPVVDFVTSPVPLALVTLGALLSGLALVARRRARAGQ